MRIANFRGSRRDSLCHFNFPTSYANFETGDDDGEVIVKSALVMVEGSHVDSKKVPHVFSASRIQQIVDNTNDFIAQGGRVPWQTDHQKTQDANIGDLEGYLETRVITEDDLPNPRFRHLIGKVGAFANELVGKGKDVVRKIKAGRIKTLSPGIDIRDNIIREISATPVPAIVGLSTFRRHDALPSADFALSFDEAEAEQMDMEAYRKDFDDLCDTLWKVMSSIQQADEQMLEGQDPQGLAMQAIQDFGDRVSGLMQFNMDDQMQQQATQYPMQQQPTPGMNRVPQRAPGGRFSYTLDDTEMAMFRKARRDRGRKRGKYRNVKRAAAGLLATGAIVGAGVGARALMRRRGGGRNYGGGSELPGRNALASITPGASGPTASSSAVQRYRQQMPGVRQPAPYRKAALGTEPVSKKAIVESVRKANKGIKKRSASANRSNSGINQQRKRRGYPKSFGGSFQLRGR